MRKMSKIAVSLPAARALAIGVVAALVLVGTAMGEVPKDGLVAEYHFDGDARDSSGNGNDGTIHGATFVAGKVGKAQRFIEGQEYFTAWG